MATPLFRPVARTWDPPDGNGDVSTLALHDPHELKGQGATSNLPCSLNNRRSLDRVCDVCILPTTRGPGRSEITWQLLVLSLW